jgi:hypothetical protein
MPYGSGRNAEFALQAASLSPLQEMQEKYKRLSQSSGYQPRSVLESPTRSGIGMSANDRSRQLINGAMLPSRNGSSVATYEKRQALGLDSPYRSV